MRPSVKTAPLDEAGDASWLSFPGRREACRGHGWWHRDLAALIREYLFVSLFPGVRRTHRKRNASRLAAMQRA